MIIEGGDEGPSVGGGGPGNTKALDAALDAIEAAAAGPARDPAGLPSTTPDLVGGETQTPRPSRRKATSPESAAAAASPASELPPGFAMSAKGLWHVGFADAAGVWPAPQWICGQFEILGRSRNDVGGEWGVVLEFADPDGVSRQIVVNAADLAGDGGVVRSRLAAAGLALSTKRAARERLVEALAGIETDRRVLRLDRTGYVDDLSTFAIPGRVLGGNADVVILDAVARGAPFATGGSPDAWRAWIAADVAPHDLPTFAVALALAGPIVAPLGAETPAFHVIGPSSCGKSTAALAAGSCWGSTSFLGSWRSTANALEATAAAHSDAFLSLDELAMIEPREAASAAYTLVAGTGKTRMRSDGDLRPVRRWRGAILSTGEIGLEAKIAEDGRGRAQAGQLVRLIELHIDPTRPGGAFDGPGDKTAFAALAARIKTSAAADYGHAGPAFVEALFRDRDGLLAEARRAMRRFTDVHVPRGVDGQVERVAAKFALVAAAGEIACLSRVRVLPFSPGRVTAAAGRLFAGWIAARGGTGSAEERLAIVRVREFLLTHGSARFLSLHQNESWRAQYVAGYRDHESGDWYLSESAFRESLCGLDPRGAAEALLKHGYLVRDGRHLRPKISTPKGRIRLWHVRNAILEHDDAGAAPEEIMPDDFDGEER